jgi:hypothetical protein
MTYEVVVCVVVKDVVALVVGVDMWHPANDPSTYLTR